MAGAEPTGKAVWITAVSPDAAHLLRRRRHRLALLAAEGLAEFRHIHDHTIRANAIRGVYVHLYRKPQELGTLGGAPVLAPAKEQLLLRRVFGSCLLIERRVIARGIGQQRHPCQPKSAIIRGVLAERELAVDVQVVDRDEIAVFVYQAIGTLDESLRVIGGPPVLQVALRVELAALVVEAMR